MQKYIFDLDGTLLNANWDNEDVFFRSKINKDIESLLKQKMIILLEYERTHKKYSVQDLSNYFKSYGFDLSPEFIEAWIDFNGEELEDFLVPKMHELLNFLHQMEKKCIILTNWFARTQEKRLKRAGLDIYFDKVVGGDTILKPNRESYLIACGSTPLEECVMLGDNFEKDYLGAHSIGMKAYHVHDDNREEIIRKLMVK